MNKKTEKYVREKKTLLCKDCRLGIKEIASYVNEMGKKEGRQEVVDAINRHWGEK